jgi:serine/threonine-protein kinase
MNDSSTPRPIELSPFDATLDDPSSKRVLGAIGKPTKCAPRVALVEGSGPELTSETYNLLRVRLRAAAVALFIGSFAFLAWGFLTPHPAKEASGLLFGFHLAHVIALGVIGASLYIRCPCSVIKLRVAEVLIFGLTGAFFAAMQWEGSMFWAARDNAGMLATSTKATIGYWYALIFTYALFIPNNWRRAAFVIGDMAALPVLLTVLLRWKSPVIAEAITTDQVVEQFLMMALAFGVAVYGVNNMGTLRREVFAAKQLGQYRLRELLGSGGMGEVYLAEHQLLKRPCAVKLIRAGQESDPRALARFEREVRATAKLSHFNTVEVFDYGRTDDGSFYYVMEYLRGLSLSELVKRHGPLPAERVVHLLRQTCDALQEAHGYGLVHRDIKPGNIFAAERGGVYDVAKLLDFGLVKPLAEHHDTQLTQDGAITGSPLYMAPEQAMENEAPDARSDIYSLGAVAYYLLTGQPPFDGDRALKILFANAQQEPKPPSHINPEVPADLERVVLRCLAKKPTDRYADATGLKHALLDCESAGRWGDSEASSWWKGLRRETATGEVA